MSIINANPLLAAAGGDYQISRSVRLRSSASAYFNRTLTTPTSNTTWSYSAWIKKGTSGSILGGGTDCEFYFSAAGNLILFKGGVGSFSSTAVFRDPSAWMHIFIRSNGTNIKAYRNNDEIFSYTGTMTDFNSATSHRIGSHPQGGDYFDGYLTEINFIDGQALTPSSFGENDAVTGVWKPKKYAGTYGTNGFYLPFNLASASAYAGSFSGSGQYLTTPATSALEFGSNNFTIEFFWYPTSTSRQGLYHGSFGTDWSIGIDYNGTGAQKIGLWASSNGTSWNLLNADSGGNAIGSTTVGLNQWHHVAYVRNGTTWQLYLDGKLDLTVSGVSGSIVNRASSTKAIGCWFNTSAMSQVIGSLSNFRILNGTALYTSNFVVPQTNLTAITNTQLLTLQNATIIDNSTNAFTITNNGSVAMSLSNPFSLLSITSDQSGNANNWNANNISLTAGVTYDSMIDTPTPYADGGNGRGNYAVMNPLNRYNTTIADGNLSWNFPNANMGAFSSIGVSSGKWYFEYTSTNVGGIYNTITYMGVGDASAIAGVNSSTPLGVSATSWAYSVWDGVKSNNNTGTSYGGGTGVGAVGVIGVAIDMDNGKIWWSRNGTWQASGDPAAGTNAAFTNLSGTVFPAVTGGGAGYTGTGWINFGQRPFTYTPPTGFKALNTQNLPDATILNGKKHFEARAYNGNNGTPVTITGTQFAPDFVWIKERGAARSHLLANTIVGATKYLSSDSTAAEVTDSTTLTSFNSDGFSLGSNVIANGNDAYVAWQWKAGGSAVSNTAGSITSQVSANPSAGFSVVTYTGNGLNNATVGHGLNATPAMVIIKSRNYGTAGWDWLVFHKSLNTSTEYLLLDSTAAKASAAGAWSHNSSTLGFPTAYSTTNSAGVTSPYSTFVAYCFSEVAGYSKFGSYTGNGSADGPFVYCGFRPRWVIIKETNVAGGNWFIVDTSRSPANVMQATLQPSTSNAEGSGTNFSDVVSNGLKIRHDGTVYSINTNGNSYIFAAFAENPFKNSLAR